MNYHLINAVAAVAGPYLSGRDVEPAEIPAILALIADGLVAAGARHPAVTVPVPANGDTAALRAGAEDWAAPGLCAAPGAPDGTTLPCVPVSQSYTDDYIICLEDGTKLKTLKRHLMAKFNLTPEAYRRKWNLPDDYPMVAPGYAKVRSELARRGGLGKAIQPNPAGLRRAS